ncbi:adenylate/guanylate cyclase domain-containing protein [Marmoricola sp. RAF53]|uniref:adenylate/guanylate cyclase domain-containing protein n=1 Tax=Marmoricola sp. RAF53 TaxID=3233059 RepID=UPI003F9BA8F1
MDTVGDGADLSALVPYVPGLVIEWLESAPEATSRTVHGTAVFADISGFTALTERLARKGRAGAEEMGDILNLVFDQLLGRAYEYGAGLVKWGGDAVLLLFDGPGHLERAAKAAAEMQRVIRQAGQVTTSSGKVRLRMSIGLHTGDLDFMLVGASSRDLVVCGPGASTVARMEAAAGAGEVVASPAAAELLRAAGARLGGTRGGGRVVADPPAVATLPEPLRGAVRADLRQVVPAPLVEHLVSGRVEHEHRNVAVCFVEFSGVDDLREVAGLDAATRAVARVVAACQEAADAHEVTFLASDLAPDGGKIILISGAPRTVGDDAARVLIAARRILDSEQELTLRAGVNTGRVFAGDYGPARRRVYSVTGDCVNLAARLMAKAGPGELVASAASLARSRTRFSTVALEPFAVKGKSSLIDAATVGPVARTTGAAQAGGLPLAGRDAELRTLLDAAAAATTGSGSSVELVGEPGIGKSRLAQELAARAGLDVLWMDGDIYATSTPYEPFHRLFAQRLRIERGDERAVLRRLRALVRDHAPHQLPMLPLLAIVAGIDLAPTREVDALDNAVRKHVLESVTSEVLGAALDRPTLIVFNDVHFMDEATTDLLDRLARDAAGRPWLIVATRRPSSQWQLDPGPGRASVTLGPLADDAADALLAAAMGDRQVPAHRTAALVARAGGNPLFLTGLAAGVDALLADEGLPDSIEAIIASRIDRLAPRDRTYLRSAAVLGMSFDPALLRAILGSVDGAWPVPPRLEDLAEFLTRTPDGDYEFVHHLVRETAYEGLPFRRRVHLHAVTADLVVGRLSGRPDRDNILSLHSFHGARYLDAYMYSRRAAASAREQFANAEAAECYERAVAAARHLRADQRHELGAVWEELAEIYEALGDIEAMGSALKQARSRNGTDPHSVARLALRTAVHRRLNGQYADSLRWVTRGRKALDGLDDAEAHRLRAQLAERYCQDRFAQGRYDDAIRWADIAVEEARTGHDARTRARALEFRNLALSFSGRPVDLDLAGESLELFASINDLSGLARGHNAAGLLYLEEGLWVDALAHYRASADTYRVLGRQLDIALQEANAAEILIHQGHLDQAEELLADAMKVWRGTSAIGERAFGHSQQGRIAMARGNLEEAEGLLERARALHLEIGEAHEAQAVGALLAECRLLRGNAAGAVAAASALLDDHPPESLVRVLHRIAGTGLIVRGTGAARDEGIGRLRTSLEAARAAGADHDAALALLELVRAGAATAEECAALDVLRRDVAERCGVTLPEVSSQIA